MLYNTLGKTGLEVSRLGFGTMRLPTFDSNDNINTEEASKMLEYGIENGINLIEVWESDYNKDYSGVKALLEEQLNNISVTRDSFSKICTK